MRSKLCIILLSVVTATPILIAAETKAPPTTNPTAFAPYTERVKETLVEFDMIPIPASEILIKDGDGPPRLVRIKRFWMAKTECTWDQYDTFQLQLDLPQSKRRFMPPLDAKARPTAPYEAPDRGFGHSGYPVISVTAYAGKMYCKWLSEKTGRKYRLPTPAEWEYACRAGPAVAKATDDTAWSKENSPKQTQPVAKKKPNAWGLYDMLGNAGEWTMSADGKVEMLSGGHYLLAANDITSTTRESLNIAQFALGNAQPSRWWLADGSFTGFRVVREE